jgi:SAM-dependent methyltransferase
MQDSYTANYFENRQVWQSDMATYQKYLFSDLALLVSKSADSVLDAGCGNGFFLDILPSHLRRVGVDRSGEILKDVKHEKYQADLSELPFGDAAFGTVFCTDVLEHTSSETSLLKIVKELRRVAKDRLVISVPFRENLDSGLLWCRSCGGAFHRNHHFWSFDSRFLETLAQAIGKEHAYAVLSGDFWGGMDADYTSLQARLGDQQTATSGVPCSHCGNDKSFEKKFSPNQEKWAEKILEVNREQGSSSFRHAMARTELIVVFNFVSTENMVSGSDGYLDRDLKAVQLLNPELIRGDVIDFESGLFRQTTDIPLSSTCPIVVDRPRPRLSELRETQDILFSFWGGFAPRPDLSIRIEGKARKGTEFRVAVYRPDVGYSLIWHGGCDDLVVLDVPLAGSLTSRYGHLFQIYVDRGVLDLSRVCFNGLEKALWQRVDENEARYIVRSADDRLLESLDIYREAGFGIRV